MDLPAIRLGDFAVQAVERPGPNDWLALVVPLVEVNPVAKKLAVEISAVGDAEPLERTVSSGASFVGFVLKNQEDVLVLSGFDSFKLDDWMFVDGERSLLQRQGSTLIVLGEEALGGLFDHAPNFASWLGGAAWRLEKRLPMLSSEEREERLWALRRWAGKTDREVIEEAERGLLPSDPPYSEWLVLLGRGDLLGE
ncbi:hypothetical protein [Corallococcus exiguus]|uniref:hypothetical protein n=1 Tax=Corallococcus exiguus TaxID=83462 RepID=UPI003DA5A02A